jgi:hypothetical protein
MLFRKLHQEEAEKEEGQKAEEAESRDLCL